MSGRTIISETRQPRDRVVHPLKSVESQFDLLSYYYIISKTIDETGRVYGPGTLVV